MRRVSHSELSTWLQCPKKWSYVYRDRRVSRETPKALTVGRSIDTAIKAHYMGKPWELQDPMQRALMLGYVARYRNSGYLVDRVDVRFEMPITPEIVMMGELDAVGKDDKGEPFIMECKTTSEDIAPGSTYWHRITMVDAQATTYLRAGLELGARKVLWDVLRKPALRQKASEGSDEFCGRILEDIGKRPEHYYQRSIIVRLDGESQDYLRDVKGTVHLMSSGVAPRNPGACFNWNRECEYLSVCSSEESIDNDAKFMARTSPQRDQASAPEDGDLRRAGGGQVDLGRSDAKANPYRF